MELKSLDLVSREDWRGGVRLERKFIDKNHIKLTNSAKSVTNSTLAYPFCITVDIRPFRTLKIGTFAYII